jgi:hypothetical protein
MVTISAENEVFNYPQALAVAAQHCCRRNKSSASRWTAVDACARRVYRCTLGYLENVLNGNRTTPLLQLVALDVVGRAVCSRTGLHSPTPSTLLLLIKTCLRACQAESITRWSFAKCSRCEMSDAFDSFRFTSGMDVWISDEKDCWVRGVVTKCEGGSLTVRNNSNKAEKVITVGPNIERDVLPSNLPQNTNISDIIQSEYLHEASLLETLRVRHSNATSASSSGITCEEIYTYAGPVLLSCNPYKRLNIYGPDITTLPLGYDSPQSRKSVFWYINLIVLKYVHSHYWIHSSRADAVD